MSDNLVKQYLLELHDLVRCRCHPAYTGRGLHDPECDCDSAAAVKVVAARIEELEAKLAKAVAALQFYAKEEHYVGEYMQDACGCCGSWYEPRIHKDGEDSGDLARATLREITGEER